MNLSVDFMLKLVAWFAVSFAAAMAVIRLVQYKNPPRIGYATGLLGLIFLAFAALDWRDSALFNGLWGNLTVSAMALFAVVAYFALEPYIYKNREERDIHIPLPEKHPTEV